MTEADDEQLWAAVADPSRRQVVDVMLMLGETTQTALAAELPFTRQAVAKHLAVLEQVGVVTGEKCGREMRYRLDLDRVELAAHAMGRIAARWDRRMAAIKRIAEAAHAESLASGKRK